MHTHITCRRIEEILRVYVRFRRIAELDLIGWKIHAQINFGLAILCNFEGKIKLKGAIVKSIISWHRILRQFKLTIECSIRWKLHVERLELCAMRISQNEGKLVDGWQFVSPVECLPRNPAKIYGLPGSIDGAICIHVNLSMWEAHVLWIAEIPGADPRSPAVYSQRESLIPGLAKNRVHLAIWKALIHGAFPQSVLVCGTWSQLIACAIVNNNGSVCHRCLWRKINCPDEGLGCTELECEIDLAGRCKVNILEFLRQLRRG